ncbi:chemotaxis protein CheW [Geobacter sp.]|uniref:chemotaxis protein CheW n=1 Tax=Geobacter sp. TaxID=46610 RepID=UPI0026225F41|nr:chemotaxis protein CheW [Geobacter sp.]
MTAVTGTTPTIDISSFGLVFFEECAEHLAEMERLLLAIDPGNPDREELNAIFRSAHSIKGGGGIFGFGDMTVVTHELESLLDRVRGGEMGLTRPMVDLFLQATDVIAMQLAGHRDGAPVDRDAIDRVCGALRGLIAEPAAHAAPPAATVCGGAPPSAGAKRYRIDFTPSPDIFCRGIRIENLFDELAGLGGVTVRADVAGAPEIPDLDPELCHCRWELQLETAAPESEIRDIFEFVADDSDLTFTAVDFPPAGPASAAEEPAPRQGAAPAPENRGGREQAEGSIRVGVGKVDQIINQVGELVITQAMLAQLGAVLDPVQFADLHRGLQQLSRNTRDLQESVMSMRLVPISLVFSRFPRLVRDLAAKLGKEVELRLVGETTELDKGLVEKLADPLTHLVRNALDHAIEPPAARIAAGKPAAGTVTLRASQIGGKIVIDVMDDGAGLQREKILKKAAERGIAVGDALTDDEVWQLIFAPGFSTAETVTDVSGRGVGMDVVLRNVQALGGRVGIASETGRGTRITLSLPLTLAILDGLAVAVGREKFIIPINAIVESLQPQAGDIRTVNGTGRVLQMRGEYLPLIPLHELFAIDGAAERPEAGVLVVVDAEGDRVALQVDALVDEQQVVIKSLEENYRKVPGSAGATIMGDGRVALILDVGEITALWRGKSRERAARA